MRITAIVNPKGGTGKTTTAVNLAASAALEGKRVLLVDLDKQGSATQWLGHSPDNDALVRVLVGEILLDSIVIRTDVEGLELAPASVAIQHERVTSEPGNQYLLREALAKADERDWVVLDVPGDLGPITIMRSPPRPTCWCLFRPALWNSTRFRRSKKPSRKSKPGSTRS